MNIKTVIVENRYVPYEVNMDLVYFLEETPDEVEKVIKTIDCDGSLEITRGIYSFENYIKEHCADISIFM